MTKLNENELIEIEGGNILGNALIAAGAIVVTVGTGGTAGIVAGVAITGVGFIGSL